MNRQAREIKYFLFSEYLSDGLRITLGVLLPSLLFAWLGQLEIGLTLSLGALCVSITDIPGPVLHKRNGMLLCNLAIFLVALATGFARLHPVLLGGQVLALSFFFSLLAIYGSRASFLGTAGLLVMILMTDKELEPAQVPAFAALVLGGGLWYTVLSLSFFYIRPYRPTQQALGECIHATAGFLRLKAAFYRAETDLDQDYQKLLAQQILVSEKQDAVRELLFKSRHIGKESSSTGRVLTLTFADLVDLYERTTAIHYDYAALREKFGPTGILADIARMIERLADVLDNIGFAIQANLPYKHLVNLQGELEGLKVRISLVKGSNSLVLGKILINIRNLSERINNILSYFDTQPSGAYRSTSHLEISRFVTRQDYSLKRLKDNLSFSSSIFKHALRVSIVMLLGYVVARLLSNGEHSYWVLLTIMVILKPGFSISKQRNYHRILGTLIGGLIGILILAFIPNTTVQFLFLLFFMTGTYSFQRYNYAVSVIFMTPFILLLFKFMGLGGLNLAQERIVDTLIGSAIAFLASYLLFPSWESEQVQGHMQAMLRANLHYLQKLAQGLSGRAVPVSEYKLARKEVYVSAANLSAAFQRMVSEPRKTQKNRKEIQKFLVLNHLLSSYIATVAATQLGRETAAPAAGSLRPLRRALATLHESLKKLGSASDEGVPELPTGEGQEKGTATGEEQLLQEQLDFIRQVSASLAKTTAAIVGGPTSPPEAGPGPEKYL
ncbi:MAG: FUSC family membrane protein [Adhaeribacter sp.]